MFTAISGSLFPEIGTHNFTTPDNNSAGDGDWVLVLEGTNKPIRGPLTVSAQTAAQIAQDRFRLTLAANSLGPLPDRIDRRFLNPPTIYTINYTSGQVEVLDANARLLPCRSIEPDRNDPALIRIPCRSPCSI
jgi:hypothetical protein